MKLTQQMLETAVTICARRDARYSSSTTRITAIIVVMPGRMSDVPSSDLIISISAAEQIIHSATFSLLCPLLRL